MKKFLLILLCIISLTAKVYGYGKYGKFGGQVIDTTTWTSDERHNGPYSITNPTAAIHIELSTNAVINTETKSYITIGTHTYFIGNMGIGTSDPKDLKGQTIAGTVFHQQDLSGNSVVIIESSSSGKIPALLMVDGNGADDDKIIQQYVDGGVCIFNSLTDDMSVRKDNILVFDMGAGAIGIGTDSPATKLHLYDGFFRVEDNALGGQYLDAYNATANQCMYLFFRRSTGAVIGTMLPTRNGDEFGRIAAQGVDSGNNFDYGANIKFVQDGAAGARIPTNMLLVTYSDTAENSNQLVLHNDGNIGIGTAAPDSTLEVNGTGHFISSVTIGDYQLPSVDGVADQALTTDGGGVVTWETPAGAGDTLAAADEDITGDWEFSGSTITVTAHIKSQQVVEAWVTFVGSDTPPTILDSYNIDTVGDDGVGLYTITFSTSMADTHYAITGSGASVNFMAFDTVATGSFRALSVTHAGAFADDDRISVMVVGNREP